MIESIRLQNVKGHVDTTVKFGRLTVLVGPNGAGKTSVIEAVQLMGRLSGKELFTDVFRGTDSIERLHRAGGKSPLVIDLRGQSAGQACAAMFTSHLEANDRSMLGEDEWLALMAYPSFSFRVGEEVEEGSTEMRFVDLKLARAGAGSKWLSELRSASLFRFEPRVIAAPASSKASLPQVEFDGRNTAVALKAIKLAYDDVWAKIREDLKKLVPNVENLGVEQVPFSEDEAQPSASDPTKPAVSGEWYRVFFDFRGAKHVPAFSASEGTLVSLALLTVLHGPNRPKVILLDDIEQTLHPVAQIEMVRQLKALLALPDMQDVQIVATTHSPYVLDALDYDDVRVFALDASGAVAVKSLAEHPDAARLKGKLAAGELWTSDPEASWVVETSA